MEDNRRRDVIRQIVKDLTTIFKENDDGDFYLPEYFEDRNMVYEFPGFSSDLIVEFRLISDKSIDKFLVDANYYGEEDIIEISVGYNPENKMGILYDLIGELNEVVAHEIRHVDQKNKDLYDVSNKEKSDSFRYYTQPHEIDAQIFGFNRLSKLTKKPFEGILRDWYKTHKDIHGLSDDQSEKIINKILSIKNSNDKQRN